MQYIKCYSDEKVRHLRNTKCIPVFGCCGPNTRHVARVEKSVKKHEPLGECF